MLSPSPQPWRLERGRNHNLITMSLEDVALNESSFVELLGKLIGETRHLQNNPPELVPVEDRGV